MFSEGYIPHGTLQLVVRRYLAVRASLLGDTPRLTAEAEFAVARVEAYGACYESADIDAIALAIQKLNEECRTFAELIVEQYEV